MTDSFIQTSSREIDIEDDFFKVEKVTFESPNNQSFTRTVFRHPGAVCVLPITKEKKVVCVNQFRPPLNRFLLEIPAGRIDKAGENIQDVAHRELLEESGYKSNNLVNMGSMLMAPGYSEERMYFFLALDCEKVSEFEPDGIEEEYMTTHEFSIEELQELISVGKLDDAKTAYALTKYQLDYL